MKDDERQTGSEGITRRIFLKISLVWAALFSMKDAMLPASVKAATEPIPEEPKDLDEPTEWQEGDPEPTEAKIPATEPEQTSKEAPPGRPMDDDRGEQPGPNYAWAYGYWWWSNGKYVWVPGYWVVPPEPTYVYVPGYWTYSGTTWVYVRGGWGKPNTTKVVVYSNPRPVLTAFVFTAPIRIYRRNHYWRHHRARHRWHRPHRARHYSLRRAGRRPGRRPVAKPARRPAKKPNVRPGGRGR